MFRLTTLCVIFNSVPKYIQSYSDRLGVYLLKKIPQNTYIMTLFVKFPLLQNSKRPLSLMFK